MSPFVGVYLIILFEPIPRARDLRRGSPVARLLGLQVRIPLGAFISVYCECCVLSDRGLCVGLITRLEESHSLWCVLSVIVKPR